VKAVSDVTIGDLRVSLEFCPPGTDPGQRPRAVFRTDPHFGRAVHELEAVTVSPNPFDILHHVNTAVKATEAAATQYSGGKVVFLPFGVAFGLFFAVLLSADIPELGAVARFVQAYTPKSMLGAVLEYAKSALVAAAIHCRELAEERAKGSGGESPESGRRN
jgi:hypothetical protein